MPRFVGEYRERDRFFGIAVDAEFGGYPQLDSGRKP